MALKITSTAFTYGGDIPSEFTCNGQNTSPPLAISGVPPNASSLVLLVDDPDAAKEPAGIGKTFDHWVIYNIPAKDQQIAAGSVPEGAKLGKNSSGDAQYTGPCPPTFKHEYIFRLMALDTNLDLSGEPEKSEIEAAAKGHVVEEARLTAYYEQPVSGH